MSAFAGFEIQTLDGRKDLEYTLSIIQLIKRDELLARSSGDINSFKKSTKELIDKYEPLVFNKLQAFCDQIEKVWLGNQTKLPKFDLLTE